MFQFTWLVISETQIGIWIRALLSLQSSNVYAVGISPNVHGFSEFYNLTEAEIGGVSISAGIISSLKNYLWINSYKIIHNIC